LSFPPVDPPLRKMDGGDKPHKAHRPSGKKKGKETQSKGYNEKVGRYLWLVTCPVSSTRKFLQAFAFNSGRRTEKQARRNAERDQTRLHVPMVNRLPEDEPPPVIIAVVGPPGVCCLVAFQINELTSLEQVGKTTLVRSLVRRYTKHTLSEVRGPITLVSGKKRRLTFIECNNDLNSMIDIGKIADLVLLMIDASFGFEMVHHIVRGP
jgi:ribosome biogenesis protein BMS1